MDKEIRKSTEKVPYFLDNVLVEVKVVFLPDCLLVLSLLKYRDVCAFLNQKNKDPNQGNPLRLRVLNFDINFIKKKELWYN